MSAAGSEARRKNRELQGWQRRAPLSSRAVETRPSGTEAHYTRPTLMHYGQIVRPGRKGPKARVGGSKRSLEVRQMRGRSKVRARWQRIRSEMARSRRHGKAFTLGRLGTRDWR